MLLAQKPWIPLWIYMLPVQKPWILLWIYMLPAQKPWIPRWIYMLFVQKHENGERSSWPNLRNPRRDGWSPAPRGRSGNG